MRLQDLERSGRGNTHFVPWFQVFGFTSGVCNNFTFGGSDIFG